MFHQIPNSRGNYNYNRCIYRNIYWQRHFHKNLELIYVISGRVKMTCSGNEEILEAGKFAFVFPNRVHGYESLEKSISGVIVFSEDFVPDFAAYVKNKEGDMLGFECGEQIQKYFEYNIIRNKSDILMKKSCIYAICSKYISSVTMHEYSQNDMINSIIDYVTENFCQDITLKELAKELGYEYHYLSKVFHMNFGMNFRKFLNMYRFDLACRLMSENKMSMSQIAMDSGFQSIRNFNEVFKKITGISPREFIRKK